MRYLREMQALLEEMPVGWGQVVNLLASCVRGWLSPSAHGWPARTAAGRVTVVRILTFASFAYVLDGLSRILAMTLSANGVTVRAGLEDDLAMWLMFPMLLRISLAWCCRDVLSRFGPFAGTIGRHVWLSQLGDWEVLLWLLILQPCAVVRSMLPIPAYLTSTLAAMKPYMDVYHVGMWCALLLMNSDRSVRIRRVYLASMKRAASRLTWPPAI